MGINTSDFLLLQFNATIDQWISWLDDYTLEMLHRKPQPGSWSLGQVYMHIADDTKYFIERMRTALQDEANSDKDMHEDGKAIFRNNGFPDMILEGPATDASVRQPHSKEELLQRLSATKAEANGLCSVFDLSASKGKAEHPGLWFFSAVEWLQFAEMHMRHHFRQKKRIDEKLGQSGSNPLGIAP